jgi:hypothetical protein
MKKNILVLVILVNFINAISAQEISYNKRKNVYEVGETKIAKLDAKGNGFGYSRSFILQDMNEAPKINFLSKYAKDTLFGNFSNWYLVEIPEFNLTFTIDEPTNLNNEKFFANLPIETGMMNADGSLNKDRCNAFAQKNLFNHLQNFTTMNDSIKQNLSQPLMVLNRNFRDYVYVNE